MDDELKLRGDEHDEPDPETGTPGHPVDHGADQDHTPPRYGERFQFSSARSTGSEKLTSYF